MNIIDLIKHILKAPNSIHSHEFKTFGESLKNELEHSPTSVDMAYIYAIQKIARKQLKKLTKKEVHSIWVESWAYTDIQSYDDLTIWQNDKKDMYEDVIISLEDYVISYIQGHLEKIM